MLDNDTLPQNFYKNPALVQHSVLSELENRLGGTKVVADSNNSFNFLLEAASEMSTDSIRRGEASLSAVYEKRAKSSEDLYKHMSDFDYVGMFGSPASLQISLMLDKAFLIKNAKQFNENYNKVVIPKDTVISIGKYNFGLYYPIEIQINRNTDSINVVYDTTEENPLHTLSHNTLTFSEYTQKGVNILNITLFVYQFNRSFITEDIIPSYGFKKEYTYTDKFYAVRAFNIIDGKYEEMNYTLSETVYDPTTPTLKIAVAPETNKVTLSVPQIYFTQKQMGSKIELVVFTTSGEISSDISEIDGNTIVANFAFDYRATTEFSSILNNIPVIIFQPLETQIVGGGNGFTYEQLRSYIINDTLHESIPITPVELTNFFEKRGFSLTKYLDNLTDRVYMSHRTLVDANNSPIPVTNTILHMKESTPDTVSTILRNIDQTYTILPTTIYEYNPNTGQCVPLTDDEKQALMALTEEDFAAKLNESSYTQSPFHTLLISDDRYPKTESFNLLDPDMSNLVFVKDNVTMSAQMTVVNHYIGHLDDGAGGYKIRFGMQKQADFANIAEEDILVYLSMETTAGSRVGKRMTWIGETNGLDIYELDVETNYHLTESDTIGLTSLETTSEVIQAQHVSLTTTMDIVIAVAPDIFPDVVADSQITTGLPFVYQGYIGSTRQQITCKFGSPLRATILNDLNIDWSSEAYELYHDNVYETYPQDVYETNEDGTLVTNIVDGDVVLNKLHSAGDTVYNEGNPVIKHPTGSIRYDSGGDPIVVRDRELLYYMGCMQFDLKLFHNDSSEYENYLITLAKTIESYLSVIEESAQHLLERTNLYFRPITTFGLGVFSIGDNTTVSIPLDLSFEMIFYVPNYVYNDPKIQDLIQTTTLTIIEAELQKTRISLTNIGETIKTELSEYIESVDVGGINGDVQLQTLIPTDVSSKPTIRQRIEYVDNTFILVKDVGIQWKKAE